MPQILTKYKQKELLQGLPAFNYLEVYTSFSALTFTQLPPKQFLQYRHKDREFKTFCKDAAQQHTSF